MQIIKEIPVLPPRPQDGHKGLFGRVLIVGGHEEMIGAPVLAGMAALRMGAGLVQVAMPKSVLANAISICPELIGLGLEKSDRRLMASAEMADAIVIGPGMGQSSEALRRLRALIKLAKPMVIDADGLNMLAAMKKWPASFAAPAVLTPHPGEMKRLAKLVGGEFGADDASRVAMAARAAEKFGQVIVLKGHRTVVSDGERAYVNTTGDSTLSKAGTGDVLAGVIGCLLAQKMERFEAACLGAHLHGRAGELAGKKLGRRSALARDVIDEIANALNSAG